MAEALTILGAILLGVVGNAVWDLCKALLDPSKKTSRLHTFCSNFAKSVLFLHLNQAIGFVVGHLKKALKDGHDRLTRVLHSLGSYVVASVPGSYRLLSDMLFVAGLSKKVVS